MDSQFTKTNYPNLKLNYIIKEEIGPCIVDPCLQVPEEFLIESCWDWIFEDFEPYEPCIEEFEYFVPYHVEDD